MPPVPGLTSRMWRQMSRACQEQIQSHWRAVESRRAAQRGGGSTIESFFFRDTVVDKDLEAINEILALLAQPLGQALVAPAAAAGPFRAASPRPPPPLGPSGQLKHQVARWRRAENIWPDEALRFAAACVQNLTSSRRTPPGGQKEKAEEKDVKKTTMSHQS